MTKAETDPSPSSLTYSANRSEVEWETTDAAQSLRRMQNNPRVKYVVIIAPADACPACANLVGTYPKNEVPRLPFESCSHPLGCHAFYMPYLDEIYP
jgi:hypothetical protein